MHRGSKTKPAAAPAGADALPQRKKARTSSEYRPGGSSTAEHAEHKSTQKPVAIAAPRKKAESDPMDLEAPFAPGKENVPPFYSQRVAADDGRHGQDPKEGE